MNMSISRVHFQKRVSNLKLIDTNFEDLRTLCWVNFTTLNVRDSYHANFKILTNQNLSFSTVFDV